MANRLTRALAHGWNVFFNADDPYTPRDPFGEGATYSSRPDRGRFRMSNERSIVASIYNRIAVDVAAVDIRHVKLDDEGRYLEDIDSSMNKCFTIQANLDQAATHFRQDEAYSLLNEGVIATIPVDTSLNPTVTEGFDIETMRVGLIKAWSPDKVEVEAYNEKTARRERIWQDKKHLAITENPFYAIMNEHNSTLQRLILKLNLLDAIDRQSGSGKLDLIIQLPYTIKSDAAAVRAQARRDSIEKQLAGSQYGIAYADATEKIVQLNRPLENNLLKQVEYLTDQVYSELGINRDVMNGTADEKVMINYQNRVVKPIVKALCEAKIRAFLSKNARTRKQSIEFFIDPFTFFTVTQIAEVGDKLVRNEILTSNEVRQILGRKPSKDPKADQLINSNMPVKDTGVGVPGEADPLEDDGMADLDADLDELEKTLAQMDI